MNFSERSQEAEWMDDPALARPELERTLSEIERINQMLGGYRPSLGGLEWLLRDHPRSVPARILDVGTGAADTPREMQRWAVAQDRSLEICAIDTSSATIDYAQARLAGAKGIALECLDLFDLPKNARFDIVHAALVLHHFPGALAVTALSAMYERATLGIVVNDLHRHPLAWAGIRILTRVFSENPMLQNDAPLSVLRAFRRTELLELCRQAGLPSPRLRWCPMFRWQLVVERPR